MRSAIKVAGVIPAVLLLTLGTTSGCSEQKASANPSPTRSVTPLRSPGGVYADANQLKLGETLNGRVAVGNDLLQAKVTVTQLEPGPADLQQFELPDPSLAQGKAWLVTVKYAFTKGEPLNVNPNGYLVLLDAQGTPVSVRVFAKAGSKCSEAEKDYRPGSTDTQCSVLVARPGTAPVAVYWGPPGNVQVGGVWKP